MNDLTTPPAPNFASSFYPNTRHESPPFNPPPPARVRDPPFSDVWAHMILR